MGVFGKLDDAGISKILDEATNALRSTGLRSLEDVTGHDGRRCKAGRRACNLGAPTSRNLYS